MENDLKSLRVYKVGRFESEPLVVSPTSTISQVIGILQVKDSYEVFTQEGNRVSMITVRGILKASDISNTRVFVLASPVSRLSRDDSVGKAARLMGEQRLRALPIIENNSIEGVITVQALCRSLSSIRSLKEISISKIMTRRLLTLNESDRVSAARNVMLKNQIDHLPVINTRGVCGVLLSNHIVFSMLPKKGLEKGAFVSQPSGSFDVEVSGLMDSHILVCNPEDTIVDVLGKMRNQKKTYALVKMWDELQGIVTYRDFVSLLEEPIKLDVPAYIVGLPDDPFEAEMAKNKLMKQAKLLHKSFPKIEEIRATIKTKNVSEYKRRYEVNVLLIIRGKSYSYSEKGWELASIFDSITDKMKRLFSKRRTRRRRRNRTTPELSED
ncbi:MAG: CBS domain-containing protein [Candidatus Bathyarchaeota archaeon]|nr:MAG: CBS domain-containing protein [Candidatus Bathyarchaeota archaeon]